MKTRILALALAFGFVAGLATLAIAGPPKKDHVIKHTKAKNNVKFDHVAHSKPGECNTCHHKAKADGSDIKAGACANCHGKTEDAPKLKKAFHGKKSKDGGHSCKSCHKLEAKKGKMNKCGTPEPLDKCSTCHVSKCK